MRRIILQCKYHPRSKLSISSAWCVNGFRRKCTKYFVVGNGFMEWFSKPWNAEKKMDVTLLCTGSCWILNSGKYPLHKSCHRAATNNERALGLRKQASGARAEQAELSEQSWARTERELSEQSWARTERAELSESCARAERRTRQLTSHRWAAYEAGQCKVEHEVGSAV